MTLKIAPGQVFGKWTVISYLPKKEANADTKFGYLCECSCSKKTRRYKQPVALLKGLSLSCGCDRSKNNIKNTTLKYGTRAAFLKYAYGKIKAGVQAKYGAENTFQVRELMTASLNARDWAMESVKRKQTCLAKYGAESFLSNSNPNRPTYKINKVDVDKGVATRKATGQCNVLANGKSVTEFCSEKGVNSQHANSIYREMGPEACLLYIENKETDAATYLERFFVKLMSSDLNLEFYNKNVSLSGKTYRPDFKLTEFLHVDVDGVMWHSDRYKKDNFYHFKKRKTYEDHKMQLLQFRSDEIFTKSEIVKSILLHKMNLSKHKIYARKTDVISITWTDAALFLNTNHLMGAGPKGKAIGLMQDGQLVAVFTYKVKNEELEVLRYATSLFTSVVGGFSRLFKFSLKSKLIKRVISFVDLRYGNGSSLEGLGFKRVSENLGWAWVDKFTKTQNRLRCRATAEKSELTVAAELGWAKIYDAGQAKYSLSIS